MTLASFFACFLELLSNLRQFVQRRLCVVHSFAHTGVPYLVLVAARDERSADGRASKQRRVELRLKGRRL